MNNSPSKPTPSNLAISPRVLLIVLTAGVLTGAFLGLGKLFLHGTLHAGFFRASFEGVYGQIMRGLIVSAIVGGALFVFQGLFPAIRRWAASFSSLVKAFLDPNSVLLPYIIIQTCGLILTIGLLLVTRSEFILLAAVFGTLAACVAFWLLSRIMKAYKTYLDTEGPLYRALIAALVAGITHLVTVGFLLDRLLNFKLLVISDLVRRSGLLVSCLALLACPLVTALLVYSHVSHAFGPAKTRKPFLRFVPIAVVIVAALFLGLGPVLKPKGFEAQNPKNVIVIAMDTVRQDHTALLGDPEKIKRSPNLKRLVDRGIVFKSAISQAPWTIPSFGSILTGKYPHEHGFVDVWSKLDGSQVTLAEVLREAGYATGGVISHSFIATERGIDQGFDSYNEDYVLGHLGISSEGITDESIAFLESVKDQPFFLFAHYFDPHGPYLPHKEYNYSGDYKNWLSSESNDMIFYRRKRHFMDEEDIGFITDRYDEEISFMDSHIGRLLDYLDEAGLTDDTAIVVVADHGEEFMERGYFGHALSLYNELIRVPLLFVLPGVDMKQKMVEEAVETRAVFSTILDYVGLGWSSSGQVMSLLPVIKSTPEQLAERSTRKPFEAYSVEGFSNFFAGIFHADLYSLSTAKWKIINDAKRGRRARFDLKTDPDELKDVKNEFPEIYTELNTKLDKWIKEIENAGYLRDAPKIVPSKAHVKQMEMLGYGR